jgi:hypothetical protein
MGPRRKKTTAGRTMRVATAFTGTVACAAAFMPQAFASTRASRVAKQPAAGVEKTCENGLSWLHVATSTGGTTPTAKSVCFQRGGKLSGSTYTITGVANYFAACAAQNSGYYSGTSHSGNGAHFKDTFKPGKTYAAFKHNGPIKSFTVHFSVPVFGSDKC